MQLPMSKANCFNGLCCCRAFVGIAIVLGLTLSAIGIALIVTNEYIFRAVLRRELPLRPGSESLKSLEDPPITVYQSFYFFNLTNPDDVIEGAKPAFEEMGPYTYKTKLMFQSFEFLNKNTELFFEQRISYHFDPEKSTGSENDTVLSLDIVAYSAIKKAKDMGRYPWLVKTLVELERQYPFKLYRVGDFIFGGKDKLVSDLTTMKKRFGEEITVTDKFGILIDRKTGKSKNNTVFGNYTVDTGINDISKLRHVLTKDGRDSLGSAWPVTNISEPSTGEPADPNEFRGGVIAGAPMGATEKSTVYEFAPDFCMSTKFNYQQPSKVDDFDTLRFGMNGSNWARYVGDINRDMCPAPVRNDPVLCSQNGIVNVTKCVGSPAGDILMSLPHFLYADPIYLNLTVGLSPDPEKHGNVRDLDPLSGAFMSGTKTFQFNIPFFRMAAKNYRKLPKFTLFPIMWTRTSLILNEQGFKSMGMLRTFRKLLSNGGPALLIIGIVIIPLAIILYLIFKKCYDSVRAKRAYNLQALHERMFYNNKNEIKPIAKQYSEY